MMDITLWMDTFLQKVQDLFGERLFFVGLQGSYARQEATETSDIDVVVILDSLHPQDLLSYRKMLDTLPNRERICGFVSGKQELLDWAASDLFQFYFDTIPILGSLDCLLNQIDDAAIAQAIHLAACNLYHTCVHNLVHEQSEELLRALYKSAVFTAQALHYRKTGVYIRKHSELLQAAQEPEREIVRIALQLKQGVDMEFLACSETLFAWVKSLISQQ